ncbi:MAG: NAD-dependent epimerase/dehydratase family protein [Acidimicrobiales bacterium]
MSLGGRVLVTGGAGFIGSTLVDRLLAEGCSVDVVDDLSSGRLSNLAEARASAARRFSFNQMDIRSPDLAELMGRREYRAVYHLAAQTDVRAAVARPAFDAAVNVLGSLNVLEACRVAGVGRVVYAASGGTLYGEPDVSAMPLTEASPRRPLSPYGVSKGAVLDYLDTYHHLYGIAYVALALANVYGPRQDSLGEAGVVSIFAGHLVAAEPCTIYGDGSQTRDFVYVDDVVDAFARAGDSEVGGLVCNIGTGTETSVTALYEIMARLAGPPRPPTLAPARPGELARSCLNPALAAARLGWVPWTRLPDGAAAVLEAAWGGRV